MLIIGIMTGNSLDAADCVLTYVSESRMEDKAFFSLPYTEALKNKLSSLRTIFSIKNVNFTAIENLPAYTDALHAYTMHITESVQGLLRHAGLNSSDISLIGLHGQTLDHMPPSAAGPGGTAYTVQLADAGAIADFTGIPVVHDFRSDDMINGGEGAPFAPLHLISIAASQNYNSVMFLNAGNTGNLANIYKGADGLYNACGWDSGPFNHFPDMLARSETEFAHDVDGAVAEQGAIRPDMVREYMRSAATNRKGENFFDIKPPKSSDPAHYYMPDAFNDTSIPLCDRMRTAIYCSAYSLFRSFQFRSDEMPAPEAIILYGGGWKNPIARADLAALLYNTEERPILDEDTERFTQLRDVLNKPALISADQTGFKADATEARIFADAAHKFLHGIPFSMPSVTGVSKPTVCGDVRFPHDDPGNARTQIKDIFAAVHGVYTPVSPDDALLLCAGRSYARAFQRRDIRNPVTEAETA